jgi:hypothetical protein
MAVTLIGSSVDFRLITIILVDVGRIRHESLAGGRPYSPLKPDTFLWPGLSIPITGRLLRNAVGLRTSGLTLCLRRIETFTS